MRGNSCFSCFWNPFFLDVLVKHYFVSRKRARRQSKDGSKVKEKISFRSKVNSTVRQTRGLRSENSAIAGTESLVLRWRKMFNNHTGLRSVCLVLSAKRQKNMSAVFMKQKWPSLATVKKKYRGKEFLDNLFFCMLRWDQSSM